MVMGPVSQFLIRRLAMSLVTIWVISVISFVIIQLPPGDFVSTYIAQLAQSGAIGADDIVRLRADYGLDQPMLVRYADWAWDVLHGDFGWSLDWGRPVAGLIGERIGATLLLSLMALGLAWILAFPIGVYCAANRGTTGDYIFSALGVIGVALPNFLLALGAMYIAFRVFNADLGDMHSARYAGAPASLGKGFDLVLHLLIPAFVLALATTARLVRILRANLLDELEKPYIVAARARGMRELDLILKYPVRVALNPFVSTIGIILPQLVSGSVIVSLVMSLPTVGPLLLRALNSQDMFLASTILLILATLTVLGTLLSDLLLAWLDPRIKLQG